MVSNRKDRRLKQILVLTLYLPVVKINPLQPADRMPYTFCVRLIPRDLGSLAFGHFQTASVMVVGQSVIWTEWSPFGSFKDKYENITKYNIKSGHPCVKRKL
jgi:hypothetical protein